MRHVPWGLKACDNPACPRLTSEGSAYCCHPCSLAATPPDIFDPDGYHSDGCNHRAAERGTR